MNRFHAWSALALFLLFSSGCVSSSRFFQEPARSASEFKTLVPFEERSGLIIVPVEMGGKTRHFLLDTGAPNIVTPELARELGLKKKKNLQVRDINRRTSKLALVGIDSIRMGTISFFQSTAIVADLKAQLELACLEIDGLIGANLLTGACLQIDFGKKQLTLASRPDSLQTGAGALKWPFTTTGQGTPKVNIHVNGVAFQALTVDTGSSGWIDLPESAFAKVTEAGPLEAQKGFGISSIGLYGENEPHAIYRALADDVRISETAPPFSAPIDFHGKGGRQTIGNSFWRQYILTIDWKGKQLTLDNRDAYQTPSFASFGFRAFYRSGQLQVSMVWEGSEAARQGIKTGDRILFLNGMDCINFSEQQYCRFFLEKPLENTWEKVDMLVEQGGTTKRVLLVKE